MRLVVAFSLGLLLAVPPGVPAAAMFPVEAVGRLIVDAKYLCTAFPIRSQILPVHPGVETSANYRNWLVTAGHCVGRQMVYHQPPIRLGSGRQLIVYPERMHPAVPVGFSSRPPGGFDLAVLEYTTSYPAPVLTPAFYETLEEGQILLALGYSRGVLSFSLGRYQGRNAEDQLVVDGMLSQGSSGGPVLMPGTRQVVGIIVEGTPKLADGNPESCLFRRCEVDRPYKAVPIDWILRLVRW